MIETIKKPNEIPVDLRLLDHNEVMAILGFKSRATLYKAMDQEKTLPYRKVGSSRKFTYEDINTYLNNPAVYHRSSKSM